jgi:hypothetical protein
MTFIGSPLLHGHAKLRMNNIATLLALAVDGPVENAAFQLLTPATYSQQEAESI